MKNRIILFIVILLVTSGFAWLGMPSAVQAQNIILSDIREFESMPPPAGKTRGFRASVSINNGTEVNLHSTLTIYCEATIERVDGAGLNILPFRAIAPGGRFGNRHYNVDPADLDP